jgi:hypothetical protein
LHSASKTTNLVLIPFTVEKTPRPRKPGFNSLRLEKCGLIEIQRIGIKNAKAQTWKK